MVLTQLVSLFYEKVSIALLAFHMDSREGQSILIDSSIKTNQSENEVTSEKEIRAVKEGAIECWGGKIAKDVGYLIAK